MAGVDFRNHAPQVKATLQAGYNRNVREATIIFYRAVLKRFTGSRSGIQYRIPGAKKKYTSSAAGQAPAKRTGDLAKSIKYVVSGLLGRVGTDNKYATPLERGTSVMAPRPYFEISADENESAIIAALSKTIT